MRERRPTARLREGFAALPGRGVTASFLRIARRGVVGIGFWAAVLLPLAYLSLLATGVQTQADILLLSGLLAVHVVALLVGHGYGEVTLVRDSD